MIAHRNRSTLTPGRVLITPEGGGAPYHATITRDDNPTDPGTAFDKLYMDEVLADIGETAGTSPNYTRTVAGLALFDGMAARLKLHTLPTGAATLSYNGGTPHAILTPRGRPMQTYTAGTWITVIYSATKGNFILQGDGGSVDKYHSDTFVGLMGLSFVHI